MGEERGKVWAPEAVAEKIIPRLWYFGLMGGMGVDKVSCVSTGVREDGKGVYNTGLCRDTHGHGGRVETWRGLGRWKREGSKVKGEV